MFRAHVLIIRRLKLHYTASGIIKPIGGRLSQTMHDTNTYRCDDTRDCVMHIVYNCRQTKNTVFLVIGFLYFNGYKFHSFFTITRPSHRNLSYKQCCPCTTASHNAYSSIKICTKY